MGIVYREFYDRIVEVEEVGDCGSRILGYVTGLIAVRVFFGSSIDFRGFCIDEPRMAFDDV